MGVIELFNTMESKNYSIKDVEAFLAFYLNAHKLSLCQQLSFDGVTAVKKI
jgi:hypothetical protein